jgi:hypothetical protein
MGLVRAIRPAHADTTSGPGGDRPEGRSFFNPLKRRRKAFAPAPYRHRPSLKDAETCNQVAHLEKKVDAT